MLLKQKEEQFLLLGVLWLSSSLLLVSPVIVKAKDAKTKNMYDMSKTAQVINEMRGNGARMQTDRFGEVLFLPYAPE